MVNLKSLAKDTAIYGMSSIVGRFINYLLVPIYTARISAESGGYGVITNVYSYVALMLVILTFGMETTFFRFANKEDEDPKAVYSTALFAVGIVAILFVTLIILFISPISSAMGYGEHPSYVWVMAVTVAIDAFQCIPFAYLRYKKNPIKFATLKLLFIVANILLNLFFFVVYPGISGNGKATDVGYAFYINLFCTASITFCFWKELSDFRLSTFNVQLLHRMLKYAWPILVLGIAGILNQTADKILFPYIYKGGNAHEQLGIYGAASKIAMIMAMITQAFRYAYEPFVFGKDRKDSREVQSVAMKYFVIFTLLAFLGVTGYIGLLKYIIGSDYWGGLRVVPIVMAAEILMGIYFNLSFWYKLTDRTIWGALFSGIGCVVLISINILFVPRYGYIACAWAGVAGYGVAMLSSYFVGQRYYPIHYPLRAIFGYVVLALFLFLAIRYSNSHLTLWYALGVNTLIICIFAGLILYNMRKG